MADAYDGTPFASPREFPIHRGERLASEAGGHSGPGGNCGGIDCDGFGGYLAAKTDSEHYASELDREIRETVELPEVETEERWPRYFANMD